MTRAQEHRSNGWGDQLCERTSSVVKAVGLPIHYVTCVTQAWMEIER